MKNVPLESKDIFLIKEKLQNIQNLLIIIGISGFFIIIVCAWMNIHLVWSAILFIIWIISLFYWSYQAYLWFQSLQSGQKIIHQGKIQQRTMNGKIQVANQWFSLDKKTFQSISKASNIKIHVSSIGHLLIWIEINTDD